jgi:SAM-dependent methyltransferase
VHANAAFDDELGRLRLLEARYDSGTFRRLCMFGPLAGARCLEVGAGAGSVARWLAGQAGPSGQVVATDTDPRFLADAEKAGVEVRRHDILADPLEPGCYDLAHCRALLFHLADPRQAVRNIVAAIRPGGWLLIEDADYVSLVAADPAHPRAARFDQITRTLSALFAASGTLDPYLGRRLPSLITAAGLAETGSEAIACYRQGGSGEAELLRRSLERMGPMALSSGVASQREFDEVAAATADPAFSFLDALSIAAWGRVSQLGCRAVTGQERGPVPGHRRALAERSSARTPALGPAGMSRRNRLLP